MITAEVRCLGVANAVASCSARHNISSNASESKPPNASGHVTGRNARELIAVTARAPRIAFWASAATPPRETYILRLILFFAPLQEAGARSEGNSLFFVPSNPATLRAA